MDADYCNAQKEFLMEKHGQLRAYLWATVVKRHYLVQAKAKYAGMYIIIMKSCCPLAMM